MGLEDIEASASITINSIPLNLSAHVIQCNQTNLDFHTYTYAVSSTPVLRSVSEQRVSVGDSVLLELEGLSGWEQDNIVVFGGNTDVTCSSVNPPVLSTGLTRPSNNASALERTYSNHTVECVVPSLPPGLYRPVLHVAGRGWGYSSLPDTVLTVRPEIVGEPVTGSGSLRGGLSLSLPTRGLSQSDLMHTRVSIGNTPCPVQSIDGQGLLTCLTQPAVNDGYSSIVRASAPLAYWSLQADHHRSNGSLEGSALFRSEGVLGSRANADVCGSVSLQQPGISGNNLTDQSVLFTESAYLKVPVLEELFDYSGFAMEFWLKLPNSSQGYSVIINASSSCEGVACGLLVVLNPCNQVEYWLGSGQTLEQVLESLETSGEGLTLFPLNMASGEGLGPPSEASGLQSGEGTILHPGSGTGDRTAVECSLIVDPSQCPARCSGYVRVPELNSLPAGVWHVLQSHQPITSDWNHVYLSWHLTETDGLAFHDCLASGFCDGVQELVVNGIRASVHAPYSAANVGVEIGGSSSLPLGTDTVWNGLSPFLGYLDEVACYGQPLKPSEISSRLLHGTQDTQPIWLTVESFDGVGAGSIPNVRYHIADPPLNLVVIDWESVTEVEHTYQDSVVLQLEWTG